MEAEACIWTGPLPHSFLSNVPGILKRSRVHSTMLGTGDVMV